MSAHRLKFGKHPTWIDCTSQYPDWLQRSCSHTKAIMSSIELIYHKICVCRLYWIWVIICVLCRTLTFINPSVLIWVISKDSPVTEEQFSKNAHWAVATMWVELWEICRKATWCNPDKCGCNEDHIEIVSLVKLEGLPGNRWLLSLSVLIGPPRASCLCIMREVQGVHGIISPLSPPLSTISFVIT